MGRWLGLWGRVIFIFYCGVFISLVCSREVCLIFEFFGFEYGFVFMYMNYSEFLGIGGVYGVVEKVLE